MLPVRIALDAARRHLGERGRRLRGERSLKEAEALLLRASGMGVVGRFQLEAVVQSARAARGHTGRIDWQAIEHAYDLLWDLTNSPVVAINRAIAIAEPQREIPARGSLEGGPPNSRALRSPGPSPRRQMGARLSSDTSAKRQVLKMPLWCITKPLTRGCQQVAKRR